MNAEKSPKVSMRLYRAAGVLALLSCFLLPLTFLAQLLFVADLTVGEHLWEQGVLAVLSALFEQIREGQMSLVYDVTHLLGMLVLPLFMLPFALICFTARERSGGKTRACLLSGLGFEAYSLLSFACHILLAVALYRRQWQEGVSHSAILRILFTALGSGFAELAVISLFALSLLYVGRTGKNRTLAVVTGAMCIYRLLEDSLWLVTGLFDGTHAASDPYQIAHGVLFLLAMLFAFSAAVMVAMSSPKPYDDEGQASLKDALSGAKRVLEAKARGGQGMRLKKGSYLYIIGVWLLFLSSVSSLISLVIGVVYRGARAGSDPLLDPFGSDYAGSISSLVMSGAFILVSLGLAVTVMRYGLRTNSLTVPLRIVGITILPLTLAVMIVIWALFEQGGTFTTLSVRLWRAIPPLAFGVNLIRVAQNQKNSRMLTLFFGAMSGYSAFAGFGFERLFYAHLYELTAENLRGYLTVFFFSLALCLFFAGICLCVCGCERRTGTRRLSKDTEQRKE